MREVQPAHLEHGKRYDIHCFEVAENADGEMTVGSNIVAKLTGKFVTKFVGVHPNLLGLNPTLAETNGGNLYVFESLRVADQMGDVDKVRAFFVNRMEQILMGVFRVPSVSPLVDITPRAENTMICTDAHIYLPIDQFELDTSAHNRPMRFYAECHTASSGRRGGGGVTVRRRRYK